MTHDTATTAERATWDVVLTIILLVGAVVLQIGSVIFDLVAFAFTDYCPSTCHPDAGIAAVTVVWVCAGVFFLAGAAVSIVRLVRGRRAWWIALITVLAMIAGGIIALHLYTSAVNY